MRAKRTRRAAPAAPPPATIAVPRNLLTTLLWVAGALGTVFGAWVGYNAVADRIDAHWRLEVVAKTEDAKQAQALKLHEEKDERELKALAYKAETGRAWLFSGVSEVKELLLGMALDNCRRESKGKADACRAAEANAARATQEAAAAKAAAFGATKGN